MTTEGSMAKRDFLAITDFSRDEIKALLACAARLKSGAEQGHALEGKTWSYEYICDRQDDR